MTRNQLWLRWTLANAFSEVFGLGLTLFVTGSIVGAIHGRFLMTVTEDGNKS
jgi:hypothetical protein